jgi:outer membrane protein assembly factor BamE (lipoprotein component of BamABCDE complex)
MNSHLWKLAAAAGLALAAAGCASLDASVPAPESDRLADIHDGLSREEVRALAGAPTTVRTDGLTGYSQWTYAYQDTWGYDSLFDVGFGPNGEVVHTESTRLDY